MITLHSATGDSLHWASAQVTSFHYLHSSPDPRSRPFAYVVHLDAEPVGCLFFGRTQAASCYQGGLTYGSPADVAAGRAAFDRWEVLSLSRVWFSPDVQPGGRLHSAEHLPGFTDRRGLFRSTLASAAIRMALGRVGFDYLAAHPPVFVEQPYEIRACLSYSDTRLHRGTIYRASGFWPARTNGNGIETWWTNNVAGLTAEQDRTIRDLAATCPRSRRVRDERRVLFGEMAR